MMMSVSLESGTLSIEGTNHGDTIVVSYVEGDSSRFSVRVNSVETTFAAADVKRIGIVAGRGDDAITLLETAGKIKIPSLISAGRGDDTIFGGSGNDTILGGRGNDQMADDTGDNYYESVNESFAAAAAAAAYTPAATSAAYAPMAITIPSFIVSDLGILPNGAGNRAPWNLNNIRGDSVGYSIIKDSGGINSQHAFLKAGVGGRTTDLGTLGNVAGTISIAYDINDDNQIVGQSNLVQNGPARGFFYTTTMRDIGTIGNNGGNTIAWGLNDIAPTGPGANATIVGESGGQAFYKVGPGGPFRTIPVLGNNGNGTRGRLRESSNVDIGFPTPTGPSYLFGDGISDYMVGFDAGSNHAMYFDQPQDQIIDMGVLTNVNPGPDTYSEAYDINNALDFTSTGVSIGSRLGLPHETAFWYRNSVGGMRALPTPGGYESRAWGVNDPKNGGLVNIVGRTRLRNNNVVTDHAALWMESVAGTFQLIDLQVLTVAGTGRILEEAHAINNNDWIVATGTVPGDSFKHAFLLRPGPAGGVTRAPVTWSSAFTTPLVPGAQTSNVFNIYGISDLSVGKKIVTMNFMSVDLVRNRLPSAGTADFVFNEPMQRWVVSATNGTGIFAGRAQLSVTASDGSFGDMLVRIEGDSWRKNKKDYVKGTITAISRRGVPLKQGGQYVFQATFGPSGF